MIVYRVLSIFDHSIDNRLLNLPHRLIQFPFTIQNLHVRLFRIGKFLAHTVDTAHEFVVRNRCPASDMLHKLLFVFGQYKDGLQSILMILSRKITDVCESHRSPVHRLRG